MTGLTVTAAFENAGLSTIWRGPALVGPARYRLYVTRVWDLLLDRITPQTTVHVSPARWVRLEQAVGRWDRPISSRKVAVESPDGRRGTHGRTQWLQLAVLTEAVEPCAQQSKGAVTDCDGRISFLLRSDNVRDG